MINTANLSHVLGHLLDLSKAHDKASLEEFGFNEYQNKLVKYSNIIQIKLDRYHKQICEHLPKKSISKDYIEVVFQAYKSIASDVSYDSYLENEILLKEIRKITTQKYINHFVTDKTKTDKIFNIIDNTEWELKQYIRYKKFNKKGFLGTQKEHIKSGWKSLPKNKHLGKIALSAIGIGLADIAGHFFQSSGVSSVLKLGPEILLADIALDLKKQRDARLHAKQAIKKLQSDIQIKKTISKMGAGGRFKAKKPTSIILGDNPGGVEKYNIFSKTNKKGLTSGPTLFNINKGDSISATPISGIGTTKINRSELSSFGGGTEDNSTETHILDISTKQYNILDKMWKGQQEFYAKFKTISPNVNPVYNSPSNIPSNGLSFSDIIAGNIGTNLITKAGAKYAPQLAKLAPILKFGTPIIGGISAAGISAMEGKGTGSIIGSGIGSFAGMRGGMAAGAALGSVVGPAGTVLGGVIGSVAGAIIGEKVGGFFEEEHNFWDSIKQWFGVNKSEAFSLSPTTYNPTGNTPAVANHNPFNLRFANQRDAIGVDDNGFAIFPDDETGRKAGMRDLDIKASQGLTLSDAIKKNVPASQNPHLVEYLRDVLASVNGKNLPFNQYTPEEREKITDAITIREDRGFPLLWKNKNKNILTDINTTKIEKILDEKQQEDLDTKLKMSLIEKNSNISSDITTLSTNTTTSPASIRIPTSGDGLWNWYFTSVNG